MNEIRDIVVTCGVGLVIIIAILSPFYLFPSIVKFFQFIGASITGDPDPSTDIFNLRNVSLGVLAVGILIIISFVVGKFIL